MIKSDWKLGWSDNYRDLCEDVYSVIRGDVVLEPHSEELQWLIDNWERAIKRGVADPDRAPKSLKKLKQLADVRPQTKEHQSPLWKTLLESVVDEEGCYVPQSKEEIAEWEIKFPKEKHNLHKYLGQIKAKTKSPKQSKSEQEKRKRSCLRNLNKENRFDAKIPTLYGEGRGLADYYSLTKSEMAVYYYFVMFGWNFNWISFLRPVIATHTAVKIRSVQNAISKLEKLELIELEGKGNAKLCKKGLMKYIEKG